MKPSPICRQLAAFAAIVTTNTLLHVQAQEVVKNDNPISDQLNNGVSWVGGVVPGPGDIARFDATMASAGNVFHQIGGDLSVLGIKVVDPKVLNVTSGYGISPSSVTSPTFAYTGTLFIGAGGMDFSEAVALPQHNNTFFSISTPVTLTASQVWNIPALSPNPARVLSVSGSTFTTGRRTADLDLNGHTLTKTGTGDAAFLFDRTVKNGRVVVSDGTLVFANALNVSTNTNIIQDQPDTLTVAVDPGGTLAIGLAPTIGSGTLNWAANIELNGGTLHLNRGNYTGQLALDGTITATAATTSTVVYNTTSALAAPIFPALYGTLHGSGNLVINMTSPRTQDRLILGGNNSAFSGNISLTSGYLLVENTSGTASGTGTLDVAAPATLGGIGKTGPATVAGTIHPGDGSDIATLGLASLTLTGTLKLDIDGTASDRIHVDGALVIQSSTLELVAGPNGITAATYPIATAASITGAETLNVPSGYQVEVTGSPGSQQLVLSQSAASDYDTWAASFNLVGGPEDDDDNDGLTNFQEYAFGLNPTSGSSVSPVAAPDKATGTFTYTRRKPTLTGLSYTYLSSTTLAGWNDFTPAAEISDNGDPVETITVTLPAALLAEPALFLRVEANLRNL